MLDLTGDKNRARFRGRAYLSCSRQRKSAIIYGEFTIFVYIQVVAEYILWADNLRAHICISYSFFQRFWILAFVSGDNQELWNTWRNDMKGHGAV